MAGLADIVVPGLASYWAAALVGAALGGVALLRSDLSGVRLRGAIGSCALVGAVFGLVATVGLPMPALASLLPRVGSSSPLGDDAERTPDLLPHPDDYAQVKSTEQDIERHRRLGQAQISAALHRQMMSSMQRQLLLASDENALAYLAVARDEQAFMQKNNPDLCYRITMELSRPRRRRSWWQPCQMTCDSARRIWP